MRQIVRKSVSYSQLKEYVEAINPVAWSGIGTIEFYSPTLLDMIENIGMPPL